ncbi:MAG: hypothetical protein ABSH56_34430 [Bryobacteraceae bacterium]
MLDVAPAAKTKKGKGEEREPEQNLPPGLTRGQEQDVSDVEIFKKTTRPPKRFNEAHAADRRGNSRPDAP